LLLSLAALSAACSGSSFNVTSADEAVGKAESKEVRSEEAVVVETQGAVDLSECPRGATWASLERNADHFAFRYPGAWTQSDTELGAQVVHPKGWLSMQVSVLEADTPKDEVVARRNSEFEGGELLAKWSNKAHQVGRMSDGVLRLDDEMLIVRYLISSSRYLEAVIRTDRPLDADCRKQVLTMMKSVSLVEGDTGTKTAKPETKRPETNPKAPVDAAPINLRPARQPEDDSSPAPHDLDAAPGVAPAKEQGVDEQRVELP
jgi:hypothetical protein